MDIGNFNFFHNMRADIKSNKLAKLDQIEEIKIEEPKEEIDNSNQDDAADENIMPFEQIPTEVFLRNINFVSTSRLVNDSQITDEVINDTIQNNNQTENEVSADRRSFDFIEPEEIEDISPADNTHVSEFTSYSELSGYLHSSAKNDFETKFQDIAFKGGCAEAQTVCENHKDDWATVTKEQLLQELHSEYLKSQRSVSNVIFDDETLTEITQMLQEKMPGVNKDLVAAMTDEIAAMAPEGSDKTEYVSVRLVDFLTMRQENPNMSVQEMNEQLALEKLIDISVKTVIPQIADTFEISINSFEDLMAFKDFSELIREEYPQAKDIFTQLDDIYTLFLAQSGESTNDIQLNKTNCDEIINLANQQEELETLMNLTSAQMVIEGIAEKVNQGEMTAGDAIWQIAYLNTGSGENEDIFNYLKNALGCDNIIVENGTVKFEDTMPAMTRGGRRVIAEDTNSNNQQNQEADNLSKLLEDADKTYRIKTGQDNVYNALDFMKRMFSSIGNTANKISIGTGAVAIGCMTTGVGSGIGAGAAGVSMTSAKVGAVSNGLSHMIEYVQDGYKNGVSAESTGGLLLNLVGDAIEYYLSTDKAGIDLNKGVGKIKSMLTNDAASSAEIGAEAAYTGTETVRSKLNMFKKVMTPEHLQKLQEFVDNGSAIVKDKDGNDITVTLGKEARDFIQQAINDYKSGNISENVLSYMREIADETTFAAEEIIAKNLTDAQIAEKYGAEHVKELRDKANLLLEYREYAATNTNSTALNLLRNEHNAAVLNSFKVDGKSLGEWIKSGDLNGLVKAINSAKDGISYNFPVEVGTTIKDVFDAYKIKNGFTWQIRAEKGAAHGSFLDIAQGSHLHEMEFRLALGQNVKVTGARIGKDGRVILDAIIEGKPAVMYITQSGQIALMDAAAAGNLINDNQEYYIDENGNYHRIDKENQKQAPKDIKDCKSTEDILMHIIGNKDYLNDKDFADAFSQWAQNSNDYNTSRLLQAFSALHPDKVINSEYGAFYQGHHYYNMKDFNDQTGKFAGLTDPSGTYTYITDGSVDSDGYFIDLTEIPNTDIVGYLDKPFIDSNGKHWNTLADCIKAHNPENYKEITDGKSQNNKDSFDDFSEEETLAWINLMAIDNSGDIASVDGAGKSLISNNKNIFRYPKDGEIVEVNVSGNALALYNEALELVQKGICSSIAEACAKVAEKYNLQATEQTNNGSAITANDLNNWDKDLGIGNNTDKDNIVPTGDEPAIGVDAPKDNVSITNTNNNIPTVQPITQNGKQIGAAFLNSDGSLNKIVVILDDGSKQTEYADGSKEIEHTDNNTGITYHYTEDKYGKRVLVGATDANGNDVTESERSSFNKSSDIENVLNDIVNGKYGQGEIWNRNAALKALQDAGANVLSFSSLSPTEVMERIESYAQQGYSWDRIVKMLEAGEINASSKNNTNNSSKNNNPATNNTNNNSRNYGYGDQGYNNVFGNTSFGSGYHLDVHGNWVANGSGGDCTLEPGISPRGGGGGGSHY